MIAASLGIMFMFKVGKRERAVSLVIIPLYQDSSNGSPLKALGISHSSDISQPHLA